MYIYIFQFKIILAKSLLKQLNNEINKKGQFEI